MQIRKIMLSVLVQVNGAGTQRAPSDEASDIGQVTAEKWANLTEYLGCLLVGESSREVTL